MRRPSGVTLYGSSVALSWMPKFVPKTVVRNWMGMVESFIESARKLYEALTDRLSISLIFLMPDVSRLESTFISSVCDSEKFIDMLRPELGNAVGIVGEGRIDLELAGGVGLYGFVIAVFLIREVGGVRKAERRGERVPDRLYLAGLFFLN